MKDCIKQKDIKQKDVQETARDQNNFDLRVEQPPKQDRKMAPLSLPILYQYHV